MLDTNALYNMNDNISLNSILYDLSGKLMASGVPEDEIQILRIPVINYLKAIINNNYKEYDELLRVSRDLKPEESQPGLIASVITAELYKAIYGERINNENMLIMLRDTLRDLKLSSDNAELFQKTVFRYIKNITDHNYKEYDELLSELRDSGFDNYQAGVIAGFISSNFLKPLCDRQMYNLRENL